MYLLEFVFVIFEDYHNFSSLFKETTIRKTCPCNEYPIKPNVYIVKLGYAGVYTFFAHLSQSSQGELG